MHRIHSWAKSRASNRKPFSRGSSSPSLPVYESNASRSPNSTRPSSKLNNAESASGLDGSSEEKSSTVKNVDDKTSTSLSPPAPPPVNTKHNGDEPAAIENGEKPPWSTRMKAGSKRFVQHTKDALTHSWVNVLLIFVPVGIAVNFISMPGTTKPTVVFALNAVAIIPLAGLLSHATESVASRMGDTWASLLNVTFGNAVELIIFIIALSKNEIRIVQASILGSILANLLLILGMAFALGGLRYREQIYNNTVTQMSACLLSLAVLSLLLPTAFHASFSSNALADQKTTQISRGTSVILLLVYGLYLLFQLKSHAYMYESTPQQVIDEESHPGVLADLMNSSSSDSSSDDGSSSGSSSDSHTTAKKIRRVLKHGRRRKSSATSATASIPSAMSSPEGEKQSILDGTSGNAYATRPRLAPQRQISQSAVMSGDEADTDGERGNGFDGPLVRDFEMEHGESSRSPAKSPDREPSHKKKKSKKTSKKHHGEKTRAMAKTTEAQPSSILTPMVRQVSNGKPRVGFVEEPTDLASASVDPAKRPGQKRQLSTAFRPGIPRLLTNTVFSTPPPPAAGPLRPANLSIAYRGGSYRGAAALRRTSSLPDRLNARPATRSAAEPAQRPGNLAMTEAEAIHEDKEDAEKPQMSRTAAVMLLLISTGLVAFCAELLVDAIPEMIADTSVSQAFIGLIILPIVGNAAEHVTAVTVAVKNKMDLAIGVAIGSSIQIALFVTPFVVLLGWIMNKEMSLYFNLFETVSLVVTTLIIDFLILDGRSNYLEGSLLIAAYVIIAVAAFFYPNTDAQSELGGNTTAAIGKMLKLI